MRLFSLSVLLAVVAYVLSPLTALAVPVEQRDLRPDHPALLEPFKASLHALARRASIVPHDLPESHLADPFKSSAIQRKRLVTPQEESDLVEPFKATPPILTSRTTVDRSPALDESSLHNPFKVPARTRKRSVYAHSALAPPPSAEWVEMIFPAIIAQTDVGHEEKGRPIPHLEPWAEKKPDLTAVVGH